jgi:pimeloyl-ACP methyl ester carboxylesterase
MGVRVIGSPWRERVISSNGIRLRTLEAGESGAPLVILAHGFPELGYSWRHQLLALADAGYHVLAPDMRGYGGSTRPEAVQDYNIVALTDDLLGLADNAGAERAVFVGHDWGSTVVWQLALRCPERVRAVAGLSVPIVPRTEVPTLEVYRGSFPDQFFYMLYFQELGLADRELGADTRTFLRRILAGSIEFFGPSTTNGFLELLSEPDSWPAWFSRDDLDVFVSEFDRTGFTGGLNWYRNQDYNWEISSAWENARVLAPSIFIAGEQDPVLGWRSVDAGKFLLTQHHGDVILGDAGHWVQMQKPDEVNRSLLGFLREVHR